MISGKNFKTNFNDSSNPNIKKMETTKDIRGLIKALNNNSNVYIRRNAAIALGNLWNLKSSDALKKALNDHDRLVRTHSVNAINKISINELPLKLEDIQLILNIKHQNLLAFQIGGKPTQFVIKEY